MEPIVYFYIIIIIIGFVGGLIIFRKHLSSLNSYNQGLSYIVGGLFLLIIPFAVFLVADKKISTDIILEILSFRAKAGYLTVYRSLVAFSYIFILWGMTIITLVFFGSNNKGDRSEKKN